ncbi:uncharacterized protein LOC108094361 [Drosophila ficusphila]|uniref:uncharacterized protein LOC108094361 n=1 Tax=Drosophila ficusphila TaxID=30025 RepID=UPI001C89B0B1|nr:uncharacterized protein LOC108094361 [Drosophila ficusphila]
MSAEPAKTLEEPLAKQFGDGFNGNLKNDVENEKVKKMKEIQTAEASSTEEDTRTKKRSQIRRRELDSQRAGDKRADALGRLKATRDHKQNKEKDFEKSAEQAADCEVQKQSNNPSDVFSTSSDSECEPQDGPQEDEELVATLQQLRPAVLTRGQMESFLDKPIFEETVVGAYVRIHYEKDYDIFRIIALNTGSTFYQLGSKRTNWLLVIKQSDLRLEICINVVSNRPVTQMDFDFWVKRGFLELPTISEIAKKKKEIEKALEYCFSEADVEKLVQAKNSLGKAQRPAIKKLKLMTEREKAAGLNDLAKVKELEKQIQEIDEQPSKRVQNNREHLVQVLGAQHVAHVPTIYRQDKRSLVDRVPKTEESGLEQYMRRTYNKSAVVSRSRVEVEAESLEEATPISDPPNDSNEKDVQEEAPDLDLFQLHNFKVVVDTSGLVPFGKIFPNI